MQEYFSEAIVLNTEPNSDLNLRVSLFTKRYGKLVGKARSVKKITSKLAGHLQPGNLVRARLVEQSGLQIVDALKSGTVAVSPPDLYFADQLLHEAEPDVELWAALTNGKFEWRGMLKALGWDPAHAACGVCGRGNPLAFHVRRQEFFCEACLPAGVLTQTGASKAPRNELLFLG